MTFKNTFVSNSHALLAILAAALTLSACGGGGGSGEAQLASTQAQAKLAESPLDNAAVLQLVAKKSTDVEKKQEFSADRVIVRFEDANLSKDKKSLNAKFALQGMGFAVLNEIDFGIGQLNTKKLSADGKPAEPAPHFAVLSIAGSGMNVEQAIERLQASKLVKYAEPDYRQQLHGSKGATLLRSGMQQTLAIPNDPQFLSQWHHSNNGLVGSVPTGSLGADVDSKFAWNLTTGSSASGAPVIAVIDCGFKLDHPDLVANWWVNPAPTYGDVNGADFGSNDGNPSPPSAVSCTHGTQVAGVIGAKGNNTTGVTGMLWDTKIMALKTADESGALYVSAEIAALNYAVARKNAGVNLKVINLSLGGAAFVQSELDAIKAVGDAGILVVASAGNDGVITRSYPAGYDLPNIISVGSSNRSDALSTFSNYGSWVHIVAPGEQILTTSFNSLFASTYESSNGTSFSAPIVAGIAGLVANYVPGATMQQIRQRILSTAEPIASLAGLLQIPARANAYFALTNQGAYLPPSTWISEGVNIADQYTKNASHLINAYIGVGASTTGVIMQIAGVDTPLRDDGIYPDKFAGDGHYTGVVKPTVTGSAVPVSLRHAFTASGSTFATTASGVISVGDAGNYQVVNAAYTWSEPSTAPGVASLFTILADEANVSVVLPFPINYYGLTGVNAIKVSTNGLVCVGTINCSSMPNATYQYLPIPSNGITPYGFLAPWWNDWVVLGTASSNVFTHTEGTAPNRKFVVTWKNAFAFSDSVKTDGVSFQVQFYENQNKYTFSYLDVTTNMAVAAADRPDGGLKGSSGIQFFNGKIGTRISYNTASSIVAGTNKDLVFASSFSDVVIGDNFTPSIEAMRGSGITSGCGTGLYCPNDLVYRYQMAAFITRATHGYDLVAYPALSNPAVPSFSDVPTTSGFYKYIETMKQDGITSGCGGGAFCPDALIPREQMAVFLVRSVRGNSFIPPPATGLFLDVNASGFYAPYIEELARIGVTTGCGGGNFCPSSAVTRGQMALFMQRAFRMFDF